MKVQRLCWLGARAPEYQEMLRFLGEVLGLRVELEEEGTVEFSLPSGDRIQVFGSDHRYYAFFASQARGPVPLFEVDDVHAARRELEEAGVEVIGPTESDPSWEWVHVRAPDGNLYEFASRRTKG